MSDADGTTIVFNVRLKPMDPFQSATPGKLQQRDCGTRNGISGFGFLDPALLRAIIKTAKDGQAAPDMIEGQLVTRVAMGVDVLVRLHQQIQQVLVGLRDARQPKAKS